MAKARVLIAMSGGVDSAVAALRLVDAGYEVVGVTLHLWDYPEETPEKSRCCAPEDAHDARLVADHIGIPHYTFDRRELFAQEVVEPFLDAYLDGSTPSPCVWCNRSVKMGELFTLAKRLGAKAVATGHFARISHDSAGKARLYRGRDPKKDQSYFLHMLDADQLDRMMLPLGEATKEEVREEAQRRGLPRADKGESQELCFIPTGNYTEFIAERAKGRVRPGPILDETGRVIGSHEGIHRFTVGQRRGLGVALGKPAFVTQIDADKAAVVLGPAKDIASHAALLVSGYWSDDVNFPLEAKVQIRSHHQAASATLIDASAGASAEPVEAFGGQPPPASGKVVRFDEAVRAIAPGQVAVAYGPDGRVYGGATIVRALEGPR